MIAHITSIGTPSAGNNEIPHFITLANYLKEQKIADKLPIPLQRMSMLAFGFKNQPQMIANASAFSIANSTAYRSGAQLDALLKQLELARRKRALAYFASPVFRQGLGSLNVDEIMADRTNDYIKLGKAGTKANLLIVNPLDDNPLYRYLARIVNSIGSNSIARMEPGTDDTFSTRPIGSEKPWSVNYLGAEPSEILESENQWLEIKNQKKEHSPLDGAGLTPASLAKSIEFSMYVSRGNIGLGLAAYNSANGLIGEGAIGITCGSAESPAPPELTGKFLPFNKNSNKFIWDVLGAHSRVRHLGNLADLAKSKVIASTLLTKLRQEITENSLVEPLLGTAIRKLARELNDTKIICLVNNNSPQLLTMAEDASGTQIDLSRLYRRLTKQYAITSQKGLLKIVPRFELLVEKQNFPTGALLHLFSYEKSPTKNRLGKLLDSFSEIRSREFGRPPLSKQIMDALNIVTSPNEAMEQFNQTPNFFSRLESIAYFEKLANMQQSTGSLQINVATNSKVLTDRIFTLASFNDPSAGIPLTSREMSCKEALFPEGQTTIPAVISNEIQTGRFVQLNSSPQNFLANGSVFNLDNPQSYNTAKININLVKNMKNVKLSLTFFHQNYFLAKVVLQLANGKRIGETVRFPIGKRIIVPAPTK